MSVNYNPSVVTSGLVLNLDAANIKSYPASGTSWFDLSGNGNAGTLTNGPTFDSANGGSLVFNGTNTYVNTAIKLFTNQQFSVSFWIKVNSFNATYCSSALSNSKYTIFGPTSNYQGFTNTFSTCIQSASSSNAIATANQSGYSTGVWYYYCSVYDGSQTGNAARLQLYINNVNKTLTYDATVPSIPYNNNTTTSIGLGSGAGYNYFNGSISNVNIYNRALSASEVLQNYNALRGRYGI